MDKTAALVERLVNRYGLKPIWHGLLHRHHLKQIERKLCRIKRKEGIQFVHGAGHRKTQLQRDLETLRAYRKKLTEYIQKYFYTCRGGYRLYPFGTYHSGRGRFCNAERRSRLPKVSDSW